MIRFTWNGNGFVSTSTRFAFVTFSSGRYKGREEPLRRSVQRFCPDADFFVFHDPKEIGSPEHSVNPYAFKVYSIQSVRAMGYDVIIWSDSINRIARPLDRFFEDLRTVGVYLPHDGWTIAEWANDNSLRYFGVSRDDVMNRSCCYACVLGFDFRNPITEQFFALWKKSCEDGVFQGYWDNTTQTESTDPRCRGHRHDQTCADLIAYKLSIPLSSAVLGENSPKYFTSFRYP